MRRTVILKGLLSNQPMLLSLPTWALSSALFLLPVFTTAQNSYNRWEAQPPAPVAHPSKPASPETTPRKATNSTAEIRVDSMVAATGKMISVEVVPVYPGGQPMYEHYMRKSLKRPKGTRASGIVRVTFTVLKSGRVSNAYVAPGSGINAAYDAAALSFISGLPAFTPGKRNGEVADMEVTLPVEFR